MEKRNQLRIAAYGTHIFSDGAKALETILREKGYAVALNYLSAALASETKNKNSSSCLTTLAAEALLSGDADVLVLPWSCVPLQMPEGIVITALSGRSNEQVCLVINEAVAQPGVTLPLPQGAHVVVTADILGRQLITYRPDVQLSNVSLFMAANIYEGDFGDFDAFLTGLTSEMQQNLSAKGKVVVPLHPREFVPLPGSGLTAYLCCKDDLETRKTMLAAHHKSIVAEANVERQLSKIAGETAPQRVAAKCQIDQNGHYHLWCAYLHSQNGMLQRTAVSSSTSFQLAEQAWSRLEKNEQESFFH